MEEIVYDNHPFKGEVYAARDSEYYMIKGYVHPKYRTDEKDCMTVAIVKRVKIVEDEEEKYECDLRGILKIDKNHIYDFSNLKRLMEEYYPDCYEKINDIESLNRTSKHKYGINSHKYGGSIFVRPSMLKKREENVLKNNQKS